VVGIEKGRKIAVVLIVFLLLPIGLVVSYNFMQIHRTEAYGPFASASELSKTVERINFRDIPSPPEFWKLTFSFISMYSTGSWNLSNAVWSGKSTYANDTLLDMKIELLDGNENGKLDNADELLIVSTASCLPGHYWNIETKVLPEYRAIQPVEGSRIEDGSGYISFYRTLYEPPLTKVTILDVGMGNAAFIKGPSTNNFLINTGPDSKADVVVDYIRSMKASELVALFITDDDPGSIGGLDEVLENFSVDYIFLPTREPISEAYAYALALVEAESNTEIVYGTDFVDGIGSYGFGSYDGQVQKWGDQFDIYYNNASSPCLSIWYYQGPFHFFFCGNSTSEDEARIMQYTIGNPDFVKFIIPTDLVQVANYGKEGGTSELLLDTLRAKTSIISLSSDRPELPSSNLLQRLAQKGIETLRTDELGNIVFITDGTHYWRK
jgi:beta-lactamase superfamily II metal-dependent hydrolase